jgi:FAD/FMN-containing dehydrogenase
LADGSVVECDRSQHPELFAAARLSLGALGLVVALRLQLLDAYHLHERTWLVGTEDCLGELDELVAATRHFEFFWLPDRDRCFAKALHPHPGPPDPLPEQRFGRIDRAYRVFPSVRSERFVEMEFAVPAAAGPDCFAELRGLLRERHPTVTWPLEYRTLGADDTLIGPASGRDSVTISVHQAVELDHRPLFADAEAIFRNHHGRPHWGKLHHFSGDDLAATYPDWERFWAVADTVDPDGRFRNDHLSAWRH